MGLELLIGAGLLSQVAGQFIGAGGQERGIAQAQQTQRESTQQSIDFQREILEQQREQLEPFRELGVTAAQQIQQTLAQPIGFGPTEQFRERELQRALNRSLARRGKFNSGEAIRRDLNLNLRLSAEAQSRRDVLQSLALQTGAGAAGQQFGAFSQFGARGGQAQLALGQNLGNLALQRGNIPGQLFSGIGQTAGQAGGLLFQQNLLSRLFPEGGGVSGGPEGFQTQLGR